VSAILQLDAARAARAARALEAQQEIERDMQTWRSLDADFRARVAEMVAHEIQQRMAPILQPLRDAMFEMVQLHCAAALERDRDFDPLHALALIFFDMRYTQLMAAIQRRQDRRTYADYARRITRPSSAAERVPVSITECEAWARLEQAIEQRLPIDDVLESLPLHARRLVGRMKDET
jgi:hypothetical protein